MRVFITGAGGFVGSAITRNLTAAGHSVEGLARNDWSAEAVAAAGGTVMRGDIADLEMIRRAAHDADATIHCAFPHNWDATDPTVNFADAVKPACKADRAVIDTVAGAYAGTNKVFLVTSGDLLLAGVPGADEDTVAPVSPWNPRIESESLAMEWAGKGVRIGIVRLPPMVHGATMKSGFILAIIGADAKAGYAAVVDGNDATWSAVDVEDAAELYRIALETTKGGERYHAAGDEALSQGDIAAAIAEQLKIPVKTISKEEAPKVFGMVGNLVGLSSPPDNTKTRERTGWKPTKPGLLEQLKSGVYIEQGVKGGGHF